MPGPGAHFFYALSSGLALNSLTGGRFGAHHILFYTVNAFIGPDIGIFGEFIFRENLQMFPYWLKTLCGWIHDPLGYMACSVLLALLYWFLSSLLLKWSRAKLYSQAPLTYIQCLFLLSAGGISHFFMDNLFERGSRELDAVLATGDENKQVYASPTVAVTAILSTLFIFFFWIYRSEPAPIRAPAPQSSSPPPRSIFRPFRSLLVGVFSSRTVAVATSCVPKSKVERTLAALKFCLKFCFPELWCLKTYVSSLIHEGTFHMGIVLGAVAAVYVLFLSWYKASFQRSGIGEEADVGVIIFMAKYFVAPHILCILAMHRAY